MELYKRINHSNRTIVIQNSLLEIRNDYFILGTAVIWSAKYTSFVCAEPIATSFHKEAIADSVIMKDKAC